MKRFLLVIIILVSVLQANAQNLQLHYDFGKFKSGSERQFLTSTFEMFKPYSWGSTFLFIDFDYDAKLGAGVSFAYLEIAQTFKIPKVKNVEFQIEYNDGTFIENAVLSGISVPFKAGSAFLTAKALVRKETFSKGVDGQFTFVWIANFLNKKITASGFADFWTKDDFDENQKRSGKQFSLLTEPQFWYNFTENISVGTEIELSYNAYLFTKDSFEVMPTAAVKWTF